jgi:hypothetical protein
MRREADVACNVSQRPLNSRLLSYTTPFDVEGAGQADIARKVSHRPLNFLLLLVIPEVDLIVFGESQFGETG